MADLSTGVGQSTGATYDLTADTASVITVMQSMPDYIDADPHCVKLTQLSAKLTELSSSGPEFTWAGLMAAAVNLQKTLVMGDWSDSQEEYEYAHLAFCNATLGAYRAAGFVPAVPPQGEEEDTDSGASRRTAVAAGQKVIKDVCLLPCAIKRQEVRDQRSREAFDANVLNTPD